MLLNPTKIKSIYAIITTRTTSIYITECTMVNGEKTYKIEFSPVTLCYRINKNIVNFCKEYHYDKWFNLDIMP